MARSVVAEPTAEAAGRLALGSLGGCLRMLAHCMDGEELEMTRVFLDRPDYSYRATLIQMRNQALEATAFGPAVLLSPYVAAMAAPGFLAGATYDARKDP